MAPCEDVHALLPRQRENIQRNGVKNMRKLSLRGNNTLVPMEASLYTKIENPPIMNERKIHLQNVMTFRANSPTNLFISGFFCNVI